jgi:hypothetical protein
MQRTNGEKKIKQNIHFGTNYGKMKKRRKEVKAKKGCFFKILQIYYQSVLNINKNWSHSLLKSSRLFGIFFFV